MIEPQRDGSVRREWATVAGLILMMLAVRLAGLAREAIWLDEAATIRAAQNGLRYLLRFSATDTSPPLHYLVLFGWLQVFPATDAFIRAPSVIWSLLGGLGVYGLARVTAGRCAALLALAFVVVNPLDIYFAQEMRMYAPAAAFATVSTMLLWKWLTSRARGRPSRWTGVGYSACAAGLLYSHYVGIAVLLAQGLFALGWLAGRRDWRGAATYIGLSLLCAGLFMPWFSTVQGRAGGFRMEYVGWIDLQSPMAFVSFLWREFFWGRAAGVERWWWLSLLAVVALGVLAVGAGRGKGVDEGTEAVLPRRVAVAYLGWMAVVPAFVAGVVSLVYKPVYFPPRFSMLMVHPFLALCGLLIAGLTPRMIRVAAAAGVFLLMAAGTWSQYHTATKTDWRKLAAAWHEQGPPDMIFYFPRYDYQPAHHYLGPPPIPVISRAQTRAERAELRETAPERAGEVIWICSRENYQFPWEGDREFYDWLKTLGPVERIPLDTNLLLEKVTIARQP